MFTVKPSISLGILLKLAGGLMGIDASFSRCPQARRFLFKHILLLPLRRPCPYFPLCRSNGNPNLIENLYVPVPPMKNCGRMRHSTKVRPFKPKKKGESKCYRQRKFLRKNPFRSHLAHLRTKQDREIHLVFPFR